MTTYTSGHVTNEAWRCFWRDLDVYEKARLRLRCPGGETYPAREVLDLDADA